MQSEGALRRATALIVVSVVALTATMLSDAQELAPDFALVDVDGNQFWLSDFSGKAVLLDFMATWCGGCIAQIDVLVDVESEFSEEELAIVSISVDSFDDPQDLKALALDYGAGWTFAVDTLGIYELYEVSSIPTLVVVNPEGHIVYKGEGLKSASFIERKVKFALTGEDQTLDLWGIPLVVLIPVLVAVGIGVATTVVLFRGRVPQTDDDFEKR